MGMVHDLDIADVLHGHTGVDVFDQLFVVDQITTRRVTVEEKDCHRVLVMHCLAFQRAGS